MLLGACSLINEEPGTDCPGNADSENITLSFHILTSDPHLESRADDKGHHEVESEYRMFEDGIDMRDCAMFVFARMEDRTGDEVLLFKNINLGQSTNPEVYIAGAPGSYTVNFTITKGRLNELLDFELNPGASEKISLRVLLLANCSSPGTNAQAKWNQITGTTYKAVIDQLGAWTYAMSYIYNKEGGDEAVNIYKNQKQNAPMFGTIRVPVTQEALYYSRPDNRVYMGEMELLRAIAKVRVVDNIQNKDADGYPKIIGAVFLGSQSSARQLPYDAINYMNGNQVHIPNIGEPDRELKLSNDIKDPENFKLGTIPDGWSMTSPDDKKGGTWIGYVPEQKIGNINNDVSQGMPVFHVTVALQKNADGGEEIKPYDIPMTSYNGQTFDFGNNILRNHIYTLSVDEVEVGIEARVTFAVDEWKEVETFLDYTETVTISPKLRWTPGSYESYNQATGTVIVKPAAATEAGSIEPVPVKATFGFNAPLGAVWSAYLIPLGTTYADDFQFLVNGDYQSTISGVIDPTENIELSIAATNTAPEETKMALLQIIVTLGNGNVIEAIVTPDGTSYNNFTIVQNKQ